MLYARRKLPSSAARPIPRLLAVADIVAALERALDSSRAA